jgi:signal transduction histidine kinase
VSAIAIGLAVFVAFAVAAYSVIAAWRPQGMSTAGASLGATVLTLIAGFGLIATGLEHMRRTRRPLFGALLVAAGFLWFLVEWGDPSIDSSLTFTIGILLGWLYVPVIVHAVLVHGDGRLQGHEWGLLAAGYAVFGLALGLVPAVAFDAVGIGCSLCPANLLAVAPSTAVSGAAMAVGITAGAVWSLFAAGAMVVGLVTQRHARRTHLAPVAIPGALFATVVAIELGRSAGRPFVPADTSTHVLRLVEAILLASLAAGAALEWLRITRSRARIARVVADLGHGPPIGGLREALAMALGDADLRLVYPLAGERLVDATGRTVAVEGANPDRSSTPIVREGGVLAYMQHRSGVMETAGVDEVVRVARLGLEHERLQAEIRAHLLDLAAARKRIVAAASAERQLLERDLHDGAQQHLIAISIGIGLLAEERATRDPRSAALLAAAGQEIALAIEELREVAHGIYPTVLADEGLAAAIESLAEGSPSLIITGALELGPIERPVAEAAYAVIADVLASTSGVVRVGANRADRSLTLDVDTPQIPDDVIIELEDRVGAVDGRLTMMGRNCGRLALLAEIPCES